ncbi:MAG TPA: YhfC family glutamic-type intramembrane protease, partial [Paraburkholderia sp.]|nr:YhfC family glutamic-type intramembrane protease [Paraburkholderia sp.]
LVGVLVQIQWILFAVFENRGELDGYLSNLPTDSLMRIHLILASLTPQTAGIFALERVAALVFQIGLSVLMWRGLRAGCRGILPLAIVLHALVDVPAALFQAQLVPLAAVDGIYALSALVVAGLLFRTFRRPPAAA